MKTIEVDGFTLFNPVNSNAFPVFNPTLSVELNKAGSVSFILPPTHPLYNSIQKLKSKVTIYDNGSVLWRGRCLNYDEDISKRRTFLIEGQLAYLNDGIIRPYEYSGTVRNFLDKILNEYNSQVESWKQISLGTVTVTSPEGPTIKRKSTGYTSPWDEINSQLINVLGGYLVPAYNTDGTLTLSYREEPGDLGTQDIIFRQNILDLSRFVSAEDVFTVLIPTGKSISESTSETTTSRSGGVVTIESVNSGVDYIQNNAAVNLFGKIWREKNWSYIDSPAELKAVGQAELAKNIAESVTININAADLHTLNVNTQAIKLGSLHNVIADYYDLNSAFYCSKIDYNFNNPIEDQYTFGTLRQTLTDLQHDEEMQTDSDISDAAEGINDRIDSNEENLTEERENRIDGDDNLQDQIDALEELIGTDSVPDGQTVLQYAQERATKLITEGVAGGHVFIDHNEIYIMDTTSKATARNVWRWNSAGLGFSSTGYNGTFKTAMTSDGRIVADMITSGKVLAEFIALFGKMAVYKSNTINNNNIGGYIGYFEGSDGTSDTAGMAMTVGNHKVAVSSGGASINGGTPLFSISNRCQCSGDFTVTGDLTVNGYVRLGRSYSTLEGELDAIWSALNNKAAANHTHS